MFKKPFCLFLSLSLAVSTLMPVPQARAQAVAGLPVPGAMVNLTFAYEPVMIKGLTVHADNPFLFDFIVDTGSDRLAGEALKSQGEKLAKYFLASLAIPEKDFWVNLSPYEKQRVIPEALGQTDMGRDLLAQDYILKQLTASLIYPEKELGKEFWQRVYTKAQQMYGTSNVPVNTFNKVWIMADKAEVFERGQTAFVLDRHLKVMLEQDYLALAKALPQDVIASGSAGPRNDTSAVASQIVKEIILPEIEKEVNFGKHFAALRQIFNALILASWYKNNLKEALLNQVYSNKEKVAGLSFPNVSVGNPEQIYQQYLQAYKKGAFNYIKEESTGSLPPVGRAREGEVIPRKYFSGGINPAQAANPIINRNPSPAQLSQAVTSTGSFAMLTIGAEPNTQSQPAAPAMTGSADGSSSFVSQGKQVFTLGEIKASYDEWAEVARGLSALISSSEEWSDLIVITSRDLEKVRVMKRLILAEALDRNSLNGHFEVVDEENGSHLKFKESALQGDRSKARTTLKGGLDKIEMQFTFLNVSPAGKSFPSAAMTGTEARTSIGMQGHSVINLVALNGLTGKFNQTTIDVSALVFTALAQEIHNYGTYVQGRMEPSDVRTRQVALRAQKGSKANGPGGSQGEDQFLIVNGNQFIVLIAKLLELGRETTVIELIKAVAGKLLYTLSEAPSATSITRAANLSQTLPQVAQSLGLANVHILEEALLSAVDAQVFIDYLTTRYKDDPQLRKAILNALIERKIVKKEHVGTLDEKLKMTSVIFGNMRENDEGLKALRSFSDDLRKLVGDNFIADIQQSFMDAVDMAGFLKSLHKEQKDLQGIADIFLGQTGPKDLYRVFKDADQPLRKVMREGRTAYILTDRSSGNSYGIDPEAAGKMFTLRMSGKQQLVQGKGMPPMAWWTSRLGTVIKFMDRSVDLTKGAISQFVRLWWPGDMRKEPKDGVKFALHGLSQTKAKWTLGPTGEDENGAFASFYLDSTETLELDNDVFGKSRVTLTYRLHGNSLTTTWKIENKDNKPIPWSGGTHGSFDLDDRNQWYVRVPAKKFWALNDATKQPLVQEPLPIDQMQDERLRSGLLDGEQKGWVSLKGLEKTIETAFTDFELVDGKAIIEFYNSTTGEMRRFIQDGVDCPNGMLWIPVGIPGLENTVSWQATNAAPSALYLVENGLSPQQVGLKVIEPGQFIEFSSTMQVIFSEELQEELAPEGKSTKGAVDLLVPENAQYQPIVEGIFHHGAPAAAKMLQSMFDLFIQSLQLKDMSSGRLHSFLSVDELKAALAGGLQIDPQFGIIVDLERGIGVHLSKRVEEGKDELIIRAIDKENLVEDIDSVPGLIWEGLKSDLAISDGGDPSAAMIVKSKGGAVEQYQNKARDIILGLDLNTLSTDNDVRLYVLRSMLIAGKSDQAIQRKIRSFIKANFQSLTFQERVNVFIYGGDDLKEEKATIKDQIKETLKSFQATQDNLIGAADEEVRFSDLISASAAVWLTDAFKRDVSYSSLRKRAKRILLFGNNDESFAIYPLLSAFWLLQIKEADKWRLTPESSMADVIPKAQDWRIRVDLPNVNQWEASDLLLLVSTGRIKYPGDIAASIGWAIENLSLGSPRDKILAATALLYAGMSSSAAMSSEPKTMAFSPHRHEVDRRGQTIVGSIPPGFGKGVSFYYGQGFSTGVRLINEDGVIRVYTEDGGSPQVLGLAMVKVVHNYQEVAELNLSPAGAVVVKNVFSTGEGEIDKVMVIGEHPVIKLDDVNFQKVVLNIAWINGQREDITLDLRAGAKRGEYNVKVTRASGKVQEAILLSDSTRERIYLPDTQGIFIHLSGIHLEIVTNDQVGQLTITYTADKAMIKKAPVQGGIDLNNTAAATSVRKEGLGVQIKFDAAMVERIRKEGLQSLTPVIYNITPITNIWPILGLEPPKKFGDRLVAL